MKLTIVVPAHNEQENIAETIKKIEDTVDIPYELLIVNDHSVDATAQIVAGLSLKYPNIRLVENKHVGGFVNAVRAGFDNMHTEVAVLVMADLCDDLNSIKPMFRMIEQGFDVACGSRYIKGGKRLGGSRIKGLLSCLAGRSINFLLGVPTSDISNAFKMYRRQVLDAVKIESRGFEVSMELPLKAFFLGFKITEVPTVWKERTRGKSSFKILPSLPDYLKLYLWAFRERIFQCRCFR